VIVVLEGPSAAGKTTWLQRSVPAAAVIAEHGRVAVPAEHRADEPSFWADLDAARWRRAIAIEAASGQAWCDGDPLKLHYHYCLARLGASTWERFAAGVEACRERLRTHRLGIADVVFCSIPTDDILDARMQGDTTRRRSNFELHRRLGPALHDWYRALEGLDPDRVRWSFPTDVPEPPSRDRYDLALFDAWIARLPDRSPTMP
jgi:hypothetical protein